MLNLDTSLDSRVKMSLMEPRLSDLRSGFGGMGFGLGTPGASGVSPVPLFPMWRPAPAPPVGLCTIPSCPCTMSMSRPYFSVPDFYDYASYSAYYAWCLKSAQESMYKGLAPPPLPTSGLLDRYPAQPSPPDICREPVDHRASPGKQLPSKMNKHDRIRTWLEVSSKPQKYEKEPVISSHQPNGSSHLSTRSVSPPDHYRNVEPVRGSEGYSLQLLSSQQMLRSPPPHPPPGYPGTMPDSPHDRPLNLTVKNGNRQRNSMDGRRCDSQSPLSRPSVITCATVPDRRYETGSNGSFSPAASDSETGVDPAIEEHFRRSLGQRYPEYLAKSQSATPSPPPSYASTTSAAVPTTPIPQPYAHAQHVESVDDHFARALGDSTWSALKAQKGEPAEPGSVDDHFAKALGETWLKLKAEKDPPTRPPPPPFPITHSGLPQSISRSVPHPHVLTHAVPQRPTSSSPPSHHSPIIST